MAEYERTARIRSGAEDVYRFLSSIHNIPAFLPWIREIQLDGTDHIRAVAECEGERRDLEGFFRVSPEARRIDWESDANGYRGWLEVRERGAESDLVVHVSLPGERHGAEAEVDRVVDAIRSDIEEQHGGEVIGEDRAA